MRFLLIFIFCSAAVFAQDLRHQTFQIRHTHLDFKVSASKDLERAHARLSISLLKSPSGNLSLDLLKLQIDSTFINGNPVSFLYNDTLLRLDLPTGMNQGDTLVTDIYYHGKPEQDASGWGGYYKTSPYIFNLGVGFAADPHSYGRIWFPCFDDFITKSTYSFHAMNDTGQMTVCNGLMLHSGVSGSESWFDYQLDIPVSSYLVCFATAPYTFWKSSWNNIPAEIAALPKDTANVSILFQGLQTTMDAFTKFYGPYRFPKIGYSLVPFNGGAMEHATNIALPVSSANGTRNQETLWGHELSHHWWGDNTTCAVDSDMWLNEGWASYSESIMVEALYGRKAYDAYVADNHLYCLQQVHLADHGFRAVSGQSHEYVYGRTVYKKGADMVHFLRGIMGDSLFILACRDFQEKYKFGAVNSEQMRQLFRNYGDASVIDSFFEFAIGTPGFPHIELLGSNYDVGSSQLFFGIRLRQYGGTKTYNHLPVEVYFFKQDGSFDKEKYIIQSQENYLIHRSSFQPVYMAMDVAALLSDACSEDDTLLIQSADTIKLEHAKVRLQYAGLSRPNRIRIEHHWLGPLGASAVPGIYPSTKRFWNVGRLLDTAVNISGWFYYNGSNVGTDALLDEGFINGTEDSLVMLYRPTPDHPWMLCPEVTYYRMNVNDKRGNILVKNLRNGDYTFGISDCRLNLVQPSQSTRLAEIYPNPVEGQLQIHLCHPAMKHHLTLFDSQGKLLYSYPIMPGNSDLEIKIPGKGVYILEISSGVQKESHKIISP